MSDRLESMSIEITKKCNFKCQFCYASSNQFNSEEKYISEEMIDRVVDEIKKNKLNKVTLTGGEPLFNHSLFLRLLKRLNENGIVINLNTNISLMTDEIAKEIKEYVGDEFYIFTSLLSPDEATCDKVTGIKGSYKKVINGLQCCKRNGLKCSVNFTISRENVSDLELIKPFVKKYGIERVSISRVIPPSYDRASKNNMLSEEEVKRIADILVEIHEEYSIPVTSSHPLPLCVIGQDAKYDVIEAQRCRTGVNYCAMNLVNGNVFACSQENKIYGNIYKESLHDCWLRMKDEHGLLNLDVKCRSCSLLARCGGECRWSACTIC